jgi:hypothetical protein
MQPAQSGQMWENSLVAWMPAGVFDLSVIRVISISVIIDNL